MTVSNPIIVALDKAGKDGAIEIIKELDKSVWGYKLGALLLIHGVDLIKEIREKIGSVNLLIDLQFIGTPDFIREAVSIYSAFSTEVSYIVVNANSGPPGISAAVDTAKISRILVGSVLDSLQLYDVKYIYNTDFPEQKTLQFALMAKEEKAYGIYCSSLDLESLSHYSKLHDFPTIVYGVRPKWDKDWDGHKFVLTPEEVMARGASKFVIGSTIRNAKDKIKTVEKIMKKINMKKINK